MALRQAQGPQMVAQGPLILLEPMAKNTAPAIAAACCAAMEQNEDAVVIVLPSDHVIKNGDTYREADLKAAEQAQKGYMVTFGIVPTFPATGYGYIKGGEVGEGALRQAQEPRMVLCRWRNLLKSRILRLHRNILILAFITGTAACLCLRQKLFWKSLSALNHRWPNFLKNPLKKQR